MLKVWCFHEETNRLWKWVVVSALVALNCALGHGQDGKSCVMFVLPQLKENSDASCRPLQGHWAQDRLVADLEVSRVISK